WARSRTAPATPGPGRGAGSSARASYPVPRLSADGKDPAGCAAPGGLPRGWSPRQRLPGARPRRPAAERAGRLAPPRRRRVSTRTITRAGMLAGARSSGGDGEGAGNRATGGRGRAAGAGQRRQVILRLYACSVGRVNRIISTPPTDQDSNQTRLLP